MSRPRSGTIDVTEETRNITVAEGVAIAATPQVEPQKEIAQAHHNRITAIQRESRALDGIIKAATGTKMGKEDNNKHMG